MSVYVFSRHRETYKCPNFGDIDQIVSQAAHDISSNSAMPLRIEDETGKVLMSHAELMDKAWDYIDEHDI